MKGLVFSGLSGLSLYWLIKELACFPAVRHEFRECSRNMITASTCNCYMKQTDDS